MPPSKGLKTWLRPKSKREQQPTETPQEQEERDLQRAIALSQQSLQEENDQRARLELLAERTLHFKPMELHRHHDQLSIANGEENDQFVTLSNRVTVKKEKASSPSPPTPSRERQRRKDKQKQQQGHEEKERPLSTPPAPRSRQEEVEEEIVFDTADIDAWLAEDSNNNDYDYEYNSETDPLASSPPSPYFHDFGTEKLDDSRTVIEQSAEQSAKEEEEEEDDDDYEDEDVELELSLCPLCREPVPHAMLYQHTLGCSGGVDNADDAAITNMSSSSNKHRRHISSTSTTTMPTEAERENLRKHKASKSMAAGVLQEQKRHKSLNTSATSARRSHDHYSPHDAELEGQFDTAGFGGNVSGLSWESRGQARYR
ncbi:hypothetical protein BDB00DRAFT_787692 [Zychaea mexicana]|uniref:uncharacterized protein n=1 Tax=Zychaea mexicana TaxID=64656 RepID=UPI0022FED485|nr:uncharacterized protein BDB00DRAFT_787692 [Zychaea mexicana]KAI9493799.1 hypothetical protein BDB00DRAFT_787692 [Zychaea mexicana]